MIRLLSIFIQAAIPLINLIIRRSDKKDQMKLNMIEFAKKYDQQVLENAKLRSEYEKLKKEFLRRKREESEKLS